MWMPYQGVVYIRASLTEIGMPSEEKRFSLVTAFFVALGELVILGAVGLYLVVSVLK